MYDSKDTKWLEWAQEVQAISQTGLAFVEDHYNRQRYKRLSEIAAEIISEHSNLDYKKLIFDFLHQPGYSTPKVDVRGAISKEGKILLVQEKADGKWCLPGGWADVGESPREMVIREVQEESGLEVQVKKLIGVWDANRSGEPLSHYHAYKLIFECTTTGGTPAPSEETLAVDYFNFSKLPPLSVQRTNKTHLLEIRRHIENGQRASYFD